MTMTILRRTTLFTILMLVSVAGAIAQTPRLTASVGQARAVIDRIRSRTVSLQREIDRARYNDMANDADERISTNLTGIASSALDLRSSMNRYSSTTVDVSATRATTRKLCAVRDVCGGFLSRGVQNSLAPG